MIDQERGIGSRLIRYAAAIIKLLTNVKMTKPGSHIADQLLRSSTSVGANYEEARAAESRADFIHKMQVSLKEMREAYYWLCLIVEADIITNEKTTELCDEARQLRAILSKAVATAKANNKT
jgi:four helix bundle protein